jgi:cellulose synthase/poly-beta-1,6-N-acetylglucosamine synthase-like glycosyltransferase
VTAFNYLLTIAAVTLLVPCVVLLLQVMSALRVSTQAESRSTPSEETNLIEVVLLMPAHNEAGGILAVLHALAPQLTVNTRLLVVADNCTDATAKIVRRFGGELMNRRVEVVERHNDELRGKGYALDYGMRHLRSHPPDVVVIVDADCSLAPGSVSILAQQCMAWQCPIQALYLMQSPPGAGVKTKLAEFAWLVKNQVRAMGYHKLGFPCLLMGSGMAFTWEQLSKSNLNSGHIVEDLKLGIELTRAGHAPLLCPQAVVTSFFPSGPEGFDTQRTRWEHGHLAVLFAELPRVVWQGICNPTKALWALVFDLCVPPLALLGILVSVVTVLASIFAIVVGIWLPAMVAVLALTSFVVAVICAWLVFGRNMITFWQLCNVPMYVMRKVLLYVRFILSRQTTWVRSKRDGE